MPLLWNGPYSRASGSSRSGRPTYPETKASKSNGSLEWRAVSDAKSANGRTSTSIPSCFQALAASNVLSHRRGPLGHAGATPSSLTGTRLGGGGGGGRPDRPARDGKHQCRGQQDRHPAGPYPRVMPHISRLLLGVEIRSDDARPP